MVKTTATDDSVKKVSRTRKKAAPLSDAPVLTSPRLAEEKNLSKVTNFLLELINEINEAKDELLNFQKEIEETRSKWEEEKSTYQKKLLERNFEEEQLRRREKEEYEYQKMMERKKAEDEFFEKKARWEKELTARKEEIEADKKELRELRSRVAAFETDLARAVKEAQTALSKELTQQFAIERKLREQEIKSDKEVLALKLSSLTADNARQTKEIETLKRALDEATGQVKEIAVKIIEARSQSEERTASEN